MGVMLAIDDISNEINLMEIEFKRYKQKFLINEYYCINPRCNCQTVKLNFLKQNEEDEYTSCPISFSLNLKTYKTTDITINDPSYDFAYIISTFQAFLGKFLTDYNRHYREAKVYGMNHSSRHNNKKTIDEYVKKGLTVGYHELYENPNPIEIFVNGTNYFIVDEYCMNPKCDCNKVRLYFINSSNFQTVLESEFNFNKSEFSIIDDDSGRYDHLAYALGDDPRNLLGLYYSRYHEIKGTKKEIKKPITTNKISRNAPCPCGSGKKFKHCCGKL